MFTQEDKLMFAQRGITEAQVLEQLECFKKGFPYLSLEGPASVPNGILKADQEFLEEALTFIAELLFGYSSGF